MIQDPSRPPSHPPEKILYVDDERAAREAFASAAHELGYRIDTADGGGEALTKASQNRYAVIATDLRMPTLNGLSLIQLLRPKWPRTSYLIVTGASHLDLPQQHDGSPLVDAVVTKPWTLDGLARILSEAIERYRGREGDGDESARDDLPILLITDNTAGAESLRCSLGTAFPVARLVVEPSLERGLELLLEAPTSFRAVLFDLELTEGGGLGGLHRLRRAEANLPIVALGSLEDESIRERALGAGAQDYLAKPAVNDYVLRQSLRYALDRKRTEEKLLFLARRDPVSGLFNRAVFHERLAQAIERADAATTLAVLLLDVDRFKQVNDSLGHAIGDRLIELVAGRLSENLGERDVVARVGGDEFAVLLEGISGKEAAATAQRLLEAFVPPVRLKEYEIVVTASIGIALYPDHAETADDLLQRADKAMYRAKQNGRDGYQLYSDENEESRSGVLERLRFESGIRHALEQDEYVLYYQPQMTMDRTRLLAVEALVRWRHPKAGLVPPSKFMPFLETTGLIKGVGAWVLENACSEVRRWQQQGFDLRVTVNLSARQFEGTDLVALVGRILEETALPASTLELEITESLLMRDIERTRALLKELKSLGVRIAIDDFGTGYSSLAYLTKFPFDCLKIDRSFVRDIETDADHRAIAQAIIGLGHSLRLDVVAEGVETEPQLDLLRGCDGFQGFLISRPQAARETRELLERYRSSVGT